VDPQALLRLAESSARQAGTLLLERFSEPARGLDSKSTATDLVSDADRDAETLILERIGDERPRDGVLAEEGGTAPSSSGLTWVIDPLDGTINFLFGIPVWCVSIAVRDDRGAVAGVIHNPSLDETYTATRGGGAFLNASRIQVSAASDLSQALIGTGFSYDSQARTEQASILQRVLPRVRDIRRGGSAALDLASVACGRLDGLYEAPMEPWDKAAGVVLIEEAGGMVSDLQAPFGLTPGVIAANPVLHEELHRLVALGP
jgi:myo-inositol-1(or 4)-monophosphatase